MASNRLYDLNYLENFKDNVFIYERLSTCVENQYTYGSILQKVDQICKKFIAFNVPEFTGIAIDMKEHSVETIILMLSILNHKCYFYPFDAKDAKTTELYLKMSSVSYIFSKTAFNFFQSQESEFSNLEHVFNLELLDTVCYFQKLSDKFNTTKVINCSKGHHWCYVMSTSGTTNSATKMIFVPYQCIAPNINSLSNLLQLQQNDLIYLSSPPTFDPFIVEFWLALQNGAGLLITKRALQFKPQKLLNVLSFKRQCENEKSLKGVTIMQMTPSIFRLFGASEIQNTIFHQNTSLRCLLLGGEVFPSQKEISNWLLSMNNVDKKTFPRIFNLYGITEISCWCLCYEYSNWCDRRQCEEIQHNTPLGTCLDNEIFLRIDDAIDFAVVDSLPTVTKECGVLEMGSRTRFTYIPQLDAELEECRMCDNNLNIVYRSTGDIVERLNDGQIYFCGRNNNTIKRFGKRICLDSLGYKIENILKKRNIIISATCFWLSELSKLIVCIITNNRQDNYLLYLKSSLENYEIPDIIEYVDKLPLSKHGKVDRKTLQAVLTKSIMSINRTPLKIFTDFLKNSLGLPKESFHDVDFSKKKRIKLLIDANFRSLGATSFQAVSLATEISELLNDCNDQKRILEVLLDDRSTESVNDIIQFLQSVSYIQAPSKEILKNIIDFSSHSTTFNITQVWRCNSGKCIDASPVFLESHNVVAVGSHSKYVFIVFASTGQLLSKLELPDRIECPVIFLKEHPLAIVGCYNGFLYLFNYIKGVVIWSINVGGMIKAKPLLFNEQDIVLIACYGEEYNLLAISLKKHLIIWRLKLGTKGIYSSPLKISASHLFVATLDGTYALLNVNDSSRKWLHKLKSPVFSTAICLKQFNCIALAQVNGQILVCSIDDGNILTSYQAEGNVFSGIQASYRDNTPKPSNSVLLIFGCYDKNVYILNMISVEQELSLKLVSKISMNASIYSTPQIFHFPNYENSPVLLICSIDGQIILYSVNKEIILGNHKLEAEIFSTPCVSLSQSEKKQFFLGTRDNHLYAFHIENK